MSLSVSKSNVEELIQDADNRVIALSGKWGTGKSHLWRSVQKSSTDNAVKDALYVSLFGIKDIAQLKLKIVQSAIPGENTGPTAREFVSTTVKHALKFIRSLHPSLEALDELAMLAMPALLRNRFIVIDDIERKHVDFDIGEVMGFIDEYTQVYGARILLILNSDQLSDKKLWDTLREKVIDHEVALETTPEEAFDIAVTNYPSRWDKTIRLATIHCGISNIRILQKIIRAVDRILGDRSDLSDDILMRVIPSTVLVAAIHFKGLQDGPTLEFLEQLNTGAHYIAMREREKSGALTEDDKKTKKWIALLQALGVHATDEYEELLVRFMKSGILEAENVKGILDRYIAEKDAFDSRERCWAFFARETWDPELTDAELLAEASELVPAAHYLDASTITALVSSVAQLQGGQPVADQMLVKWLEDFRKKEFTEFHYQNRFGREVHPEILQEFKALEERLSPLPSLLDVCKHIAKNNAWGEPQEDAMRAATSEQFQTEIKRLSGPDLKTFMTQNMEYFSNRRNCEKHFGSAMQSFLDACRVICFEDEVPRRTKMIRMLFRESHAESMLDVYNHPLPL